MIEILGRDKQILLWSSEEFDVILMQDANLGETLPCHRSHVSSIAEGLWILSPRIELIISLFAQDLLSRETQPLRGFPPVQF